MVILVVAAHPDDEVLGCGGTIARLTAQHDVHIRILGEGVSSRHRSRTEADMAAVERLHAQTREVAAKLGARSATVERFPDNRFDQVPLLDLVKKVEDWVDDLAPDAVYTHHPGDLNIDHVLTFRSVMTAVRPLSSCRVRDVYAFEVVSSTEWAFQRFHPPFAPNVFVDISATIETKVAALTAYLDEVREFPHPRSPEGLRAQAQRWGTVVGRRYAEAFELIRSVQ